MRILLIAYGNPYRGDDGIGAWILQKGDRLLFPRLPAPFPEERNGYICHPEERCAALEDRQDPSQKQLRMTRKDGSGGQSPFCHAEWSEASGIDEPAHRQDPSASPQDDENGAEDHKTITLDKLILQELTLDLAETLAQYDRVVFIDAAISGEPVTWRELKAENVSSPLSHHLPPEKLLFYAELLYQKAPQAFLLSVRGDSFEFEEHLSPVAEKNSWLALKQLEDFLFSVLSA